MAISKTAPMFNVYIQGKLPGGKPCVYVGETKKTAEEAISIARHARKIADGNVVLALREDFPQNLVLRMFNTKTKTQAQEIKSLRDSLDLALNTRTRKMFSFLA